MKRTRILACPACRVLYDIHILTSGADGTVDDGFLICHRCFVAVPVINGLPVFLKQILWDPDNCSTAFQQIAKQLLGNVVDYERFLHLKNKKPVFDSYAAFRPFNESTQPVIRLFELLFSKMRSGDLIVDLWCRTGWTGELLAALFPEQTVISLWDNTGGVMGLKGFSYWLPPDMRRPNLEIILHSPDDPLPFMDGSVAFVHGLDTLHRYRHQPLISECLRIKKDNAPILFSHIHLSNSEPEPFFERGLVQLHGKHYQSYFKKVLASSGQQAFVISEKELFESMDGYELRDDPDTAHYNAHILITDGSDGGRLIPCAKKNAGEYIDGYLVINPLYEVDLTQGNAVISENTLAGGVKDLLRNHPLYHDTLKLHAPIALDNAERRILYWAQRLKNLGEIARLLCIPFNDVFDVVSALERKQLVQLQNISHAMARLQHYYTTQELLPVLGGATLQALWVTTVKLYPNNSFLLLQEDGSIFKYKDADIICRMLVSYLLSRGLTAGDYIVIGLDQSPESVFLFWASVLAGIVVVPVNPLISEDAYRKVLARVKPRLVFTSGDRHQETASKECEFIVLDSRNGKHDALTALVSDHAPVQSLPKLNEAMDAVILFTSGSTGVPKGVVLSHASLYHSSRTMSEVYQFNEHDRVVSTGAFYTMSGIRNPCVLPLHSGASVLLPIMTEYRGPMEIMQLCMEFEATILTTTPGFLAFWAGAVDKLAYFKAHRLRAVLCTGSTLHSSHVTTFATALDCKVFDYYGLTETCGACIFVVEEASNGDYQVIGKPIGCLVDILDNNGQSLPAGTTGELAIYTANMASSYLGDDIDLKQRLREGWLLTGDMAFVNKDGCIAMLGRNDSLIIDRNGENVYPDEIENAINAIDIVIESHVTSYQDKLLVTQIVALVVLDQEKGEVTRPREILGSKLKAKLPPAHIPSQYILVNDIPRGVEGKVDRHAVQRIVSDNIT